MEVESRVVLSLSALFVNQNIYIYTSIYICAIDFLAFRISEAMNAAASVGK